MAHPVLSSQLCQRLQTLDFHRYVSLSPLLLGCIALSGRTRCANCGFTPIGAEICISLCLTLTGSFGPTLCLLRPMNEKTFFEQSVAREYLLEGETASLIGDETVELLW